MICTNFRFLPRLDLSTELTNGNKHAGDAGEAANHHRAEENPSPAPFVHDVPTDEI